jgi:hypothetical protein
MSVAELAKKLSLTEIQRVSLQELADLKKPKLRAVVDKESKGSINVRLCTQSGGIFVHRAFLLEEEIVDWEQCFKYAQEDALAEKKEHIRMFGIKNRVLEALS